MVRYAAIKTGVAADLLAPSVKLCRAEAVGSGAFEPAADPLAGFCDPGRILDQREAQVAFAASPEADAGSGGHMRSFDQVDGCSLRALLPQTRRELAPDEHGAARLRHCRPARLVQAIDQRRTSEISSLNGT